MLANSVEFLTPPSIESLDLGVLAPDPGREPCREFACETFREFTAELTAEILFLERGDGHGEWLGGGLGWVVGGSLVEK